MNLAEYASACLKIEEGFEEKISDPEYTPAEARRWRLRQLRRLRDSLSEAVMEVPPDPEPPGQTVAEILAGGTDEAVPAFLPEIPTQLDIDILEAMDILGRRKDYDWLNAQVRRKYPDHEGQWYELPIERRDAVLKGLKRMIDERAAA